ncbi:MAG: hypothetical protein LUE87_12395, partial [Lachnospiraceae bacterium]|nr:hypothetical protein [Lachnospiraceae bacterium]
MMKLGETSHKNDMVFVSVVFICSVIVRFLMIPEYRVIGVYCDELRYLDIARSLLSSGSLSIRGVATYFSKILYSIAIIPAMTLDNPVDQIRMAGIINAVWISSSVIPAYLLSKCISSSRTVTMFAVLITTVMPFMTFSMGFM